MAINLGVLWAVEFLGLSSNLALREERESEREKREKGSGVGREIGRAHV